ncbi:MAG: cyclic nucleotide-binding domain-containing protein [Actinomycetota bacterium]
MDPGRLKTIPLFAELSEDERQQIARWADEVDIREGEHLVHQGAFAHEFFVILEGTAEVTKDGKHLTELGPGDFFGEIALLEEERRTASVTAKTPMKVVVMFGRDFRQMDQQMPHVAQKIQQTLEERIQR